MSEEVKTISFGDKVYDINSLSNRVSSGFEQLFELQRRMDELGQDLEIYRNAYVKISENLSSHLEQDEIPEIEPVEIPETI